MPVVTVWYAVRGFVCFNPRSSVSWYTTKSPRI